MMLAGPNGSLTLLVPACMTIASPGEAEYLLNLTAATLAISAAIKWYGAFEIVLQVRRLLVAMNPSLRRTATLLCEFALCLVS